MLSSLLSLLAVAVSLSAASPQLPDDPDGLERIQTSSGAQVRVKDATGFCEMTEGVSSYTGYVDLSPDVHIHFWLFQSRTGEDAATTLYVPGGPLSDSTSIAIVVGPCSLNEDNTDLVKNELSWNTDTNLLLIDMPVGNGFSYSEEEPGFNEGGEIIPTEPEEADGRYPTARYDIFDTTTETADQVYDAVAALFEARSEFAPQMQSYKINVAGFSYAGRVGPVVMNTFNQRNEDEEAQFELGTLALFASCPDDRYSEISYPEFAINNTYGIRMVNETAARGMQQAVPRCKELIDECRTLTFEADGQKEFCSEAVNFCFDNIFLVPTIAGLRDINDIRKPNENVPAGELPEDDFVEDPTIVFFNRPEVQDLLGVRINYTTIAYQIFSEEFLGSGDHAFGFSLQAMEELLEAGAAVHLFTGDADYNCNWVHAEQIANDLKHSGQDQFLEAGYAPFMVDGEEKGAVRQHGRLSFTRLYDAGHFVTNDQPEASFAFFQRVLNGRAVADDAEPRDGEEFHTEGPAKSEYINTFVPLPDGLEDAGGPPLPLTPGGKLSDNKSSENEDEEQANQPNAAGHQEVSLWIATIVSFCVGVFFSS